MAPPSTGIRRSAAGLATLGAAATLVPGLLLYLLLRALGLAVAPAGLLGLLVMFVGCFAFAWWLFGRGRPR